MSARLDSTADAGQIQTSRNLPRRRGKAASTIELEQQIIDIVKERAPITVRGVCYALFALGLVPDMSIGSTQKISRVMTNMRELGELDWTLVVDGTRPVERADTWRDTDALIRAAVAGYRKDRWQDQPALVEVWSEKSTVAGILAPVLEDYGVTFRVMRGFGSFSALRQAAEASHTARGRMPVVLYLGDWDPSGLFMSEADLPERLERYGSQWQLERVALCLDDLDALPSFPTVTKANDARYAWYLKHSVADPTRSWELDAMDPVDLRERVASSIARFIDADAWKRAAEVEQAEVESMRAFGAEWARQLRRGVQ